MKSVIKMTALAAGFALLPAAAHAQAAAAPAAAPTPAPTTGTGVAVLDVDAAVENSAAFQAAMTQIQKTYVTQINATKTRQTALQAEMNVLRTELENLQKNPATPPATMQAKATAAQAKANAAQQELQRMSIPYERPAAYVREQIAGKLEQAIKQAMSAKRIGIVLRPEAAYPLVAQSLDLTTDVVTQLNALIPSAQIMPPANWQPGQGDQPAGAPAGR